MITLQNHRSSIVGRPTSDGNKFLLFGSIAKNNSNGPAIVQIDRKIVSYILLFFLSNESSNGSGSGIGSDSIKPAFCSRSKIF